MYQHLTKLSLAGVVAVIVTVGPAHAFHKGVVHGSGGAGETIQTLDSLSPCTTGQVPKKQGDGNWLCEDDTDTTIPNTNAETICATDLFLDGDGICVAVPSVADVTDLQTQISEIQQIVEPKLVFVTGGGGGQFNGALGGAGGADTKCQAAADAATPALVGVFQAWLSDSSSTPTLRWATLSLGPYFLLNGQVIAASYGDLTDGSLNTPINIDENGAVVVVTPEVWTGTDRFGGATANNCSDWTSGTLGNGDVGTTASATSTWTEATDGFCTSNIRLLCFEQ